MWSPIADSQQNPDDATGSGLWALGSGQRFPPGPQPPALSRVVIPSGYSGLTLVELLLTITLFSALLASVGSLLRSGLQAQVTWGKAAEPYQRMARSAEQLERDLEFARPFFGVAFAGAQQSIEFARVDTISSKDGQPVTDWLRVLYHLDDEDDGLSLIRDEFVWRDHADQPIRSDVLLRLADGTWSFGMLDAQKQFMWVDSWDGKKYGVPRLVQFEFTLPAVGNQPPVHLIRVMRNPSGNLPMQEAP